jgi:integrase
MGKETKRLTAQGVKALTTPGRHADGENLFLVVSKNGSKSWAFIYRRGGRTREAGLGSTSRVSLAAARVEAAKGRKLLGEKLDPITEWRRPAATSIPTFEAAAKDWLATKALKWRSEKQRLAVAALLGVHAEPAKTIRPRSAAKRKEPKELRVATEGKVLKKEIAAHCRPIAVLPVNEIETRHVLACLKPLWLRAPVNGKALRGYIENVLNAARAAGFIDENRANPARWRGHLEHLLPNRPASAVRHHAALAYTKVPALVRELHAARRAEEGAYCASAYALEFLVLTATRSGEARGARWSEIDLDARTWTLPRERMKSDREFIIPLSDAATAIVVEMATIRANDFVFPGALKSGPMADKTFGRLLARLGFSCTVHGFRSAFRDWAGNKTHFPREVAEAALAHAVGDSVERAYRRDDALEKRRELMEAWAKYVEPAPPGIVVSFKRA